MPSRLIEAERLASGNILSSRPGSNASLIIDYECLMHQGERNNGLVFRGFKVPRCDLHLY